MIINKSRYKNINYYTATVRQELEGQPIIIHIHGAGSRGNDLDTAINSNPILKYMDKKSNFPFKIYAPQCFADTWFDIYEQLVDFVKFVKETNGNSDVYLTGISMGGYCSWQLLASLPSFFNKSIICCGGGMYWNADRIKTPVKIFHGKLDKTVFYSESVNMYNAIIDNGGKAELTLYEDLEHDCWDKTFSNSENYDWLLL